MHRILLPVVCLGLIFATETRGEKPLAPPPLLAAPEDPAAEVAWGKIAAQPSSLNIPPAWRAEEPKEEEVQKWIGPEGERLKGLAEEARSFARQYPASAHVPAALEAATQALYAAVKLGLPSAQASLAQLDIERLQRPGLNAEERLQIRTRQVQMESQATLAAGQKEAQSLSAKGDPVGREAADHAVDAAQVEARRKFLAGAQKLILEFPGREEPYAMVVEAAGEGDDAETRAVLAQLATAPETPAEVRERVEAIQRRVEALGKKFELKFTALDGREVDLEKLQGKVVLLDFWATWCGPCVAALPNVKQVYEELRKANFEIVGISFDQDRGRLEQFVKTKEMPWPQYFDGKGWQNEIGLKYAIGSIPTMWLVDQHGILRDCHANVNLAEKVKGLMAEGKPE